MHRNYLEIARSGVDSILQADGSDYVFKYRECQQVLGNTISEIKQDLQGKPFRDTAEEIRFFKEDAPHIWGQYLFYETLVKIEAARKYESAGTFRAGLESSLEQTERFLKKHRGKWAYYYEGRTGKDKRLFTRHGTHKGKNPIIDIRIDRDFTFGAWWLSRMRENELLRNWLTAELNAPSEARPQKKLKWNASQVAAVEIFKAMHLAGAFGEETFQSVMDWVSEKLDVDTRTHTNVLDNIAQRKVDKTKFLSELLKKMNEFINAKG